MNNEYIVEENLSGTRIDNIVALDCDISRATVQRLIDEENILVNGKNVKASYKVSTRR